MRELNKKYWPGRARVTVDQKDQDAVVKWIGQNVSNWNHVYVVSRGKHIRDYYFQSEELATLFALRWS